MFAICRMASRVREYLHRYASDGIQCGNVWSMTINRAQPNALKMFSDRLDPPKSPFADDPAGWVGHRLREHITVKQKEILDSVIDHKHTAVHSSNSIGKSFSMARLAAWWIEIHGPGEAFVVTTAPTWHQVESILWKELARAHRKGMLSGKILGDCEWKINMGPGPDELVAYGRKPADYDAGSFLGIQIGRASWGERAWSSAAAA